MHLVHRRRCAVPRGEGVVVGHIAPLLARTDFGVPRAPQLAQCPVEGQPMTERVEVGRGEPCTFVLHNPQPDNLEVLWVPPQGGDEKRYAIVDYNSTTSMSSYTGDVWRVRSRHGTLQKEFAVPRCRDGQPHPIVTVPPCASEEVVPPSSPCAAVRPSCVHAGALTKVWLPPRAFDRTSFTRYALDLHLSTPRDGFVGSWR